MIAVAGGTAGIIGTAGASREAHWLLSEFAKERDRLRESYVLGGAGNVAFQDLCAVVEESRAANWDGYGATPVSQEAFMYASHFLRTMPLGTPAPGIGIEPDGDLTLEWHVSAYRTLSVSVSADANLHYSALIGPNTMYGTEAFLGDIPQIILDLIRRVTAA
jgi:hypothetical protein